MKRIVDNLKWSKIESNLRNIHSGWLVAVEVDLYLYDKQVELLVDSIKKKLPEGTPPMPIDLGFARITFEKSNVVSASQTAVMRSFRDAVKVAGEEDYEGGPNEIRYSDLRRLIGRRLDEALEQLSSKVGCRVAVFDVAHFLGTLLLLQDIFIGTPTVRFKRTRRAVSYREKDRLFCDGPYSAIDLVVAFAGNQPVESLIEPQSSCGERCEELLLGGHIEPKLPSNTIESVRKVLSDFRRKPRA